MIGTNTGNYEIQPGDTIYMSRSGDDFDSIAKHFHVFKKALLASNPLSDSGTLRIGLRLVIPTHLINTQIALADSRKSFAAPTFTW